MAVRNPNAAGREEACQTTLRSPTPADLFPFLLGQHHLGGNRRSVRDVVFAAFSSFRDGEGQGNIGRIDFWRRDTPTAHSRPRSLKAWRKDPLDPYPASASTQPKPAPEAMTRSISSIAISGFVSAVCRSFGTWARAMRSGSSVQVSGRNSRRPTITGTSRDASVTETRVGGLAKCRGVLWGNANRV